jgi:serine/threonine protein phosphatase 1
MKNPVKQLPPNTLGRDFVIGDLHGSFSCLDNLLTNIKFDPAADRLISVGDLVDRGPESLLCLELLYQPWFHCVLSNHEQMMLEAFHGGYMGRFWLQNGGSWGIAALNDWQHKQRNEFIKASGGTLEEGRVPTYDSVRVWDALELVKELPYILTVNMPDGKKFHIIHAELPFDYGEKITDALLANPEKVMDLATHNSEDGTFLIWGRFIYYNFCRADLSNTAKVGRIVKDMMSRPGRNIFNDELSHIISGHTILHRPFTILGQTNIDTGAYGSYEDDGRKYQALTAVELGTWTFYQATENTFCIVEPLLVNKQQLEEKQND